MNPIGSTFRILETSIDSFFKMDTKEEAVARFFLFHSIHTDYGDGVMDRGKSEEVKVENIWKIYPCITNIKPVTIILFQNPAEKIS